MTATTPFRQAATRHRETAENVRTLLGVLGIYLLFFGLIGVVWSSRSALAQARYASILFGRLPPDAELRQARRALRLDSRLYAVCIRAAETAFKAAEDSADPAASESYRRDAAFWVGRGLNLNPWLIELRYLEARLLARESPAAGAAAWKAYVDWHFWEPGNLEHLARFQEAAGQDAEALETLEYLRPWPQHDAWRNAIEARLRGTAPTPSAPRPIPVESPRGRP